MVLIEYSAEKNGVGGKLRCSKMCALLLGGPPHNAFVRKVVKVVKIHFILGLGTMPRA